MITSFNLIRNIGRFDSVTTGANHPFAQLTLIYAENGRGKTTLSAILRSLATGDPIPINERRRLAAQHPPHAIVACTGGPIEAMFQNGAWNRTLPEVVIFDDVFVDKNVYSGLIVGSDHRQNLHELILGSQGVALNQQLQAHITRIEEHNTEIRQYGSAISVNERRGLSIDNFCALQVNPTIDQEMQTAEQNLAASRQQDSIRTTSELPQLGLPDIDLHRIEEMLSAGLPNLDATAAEQVQDHLGRIGNDSEQWVAEGMERQNTLFEADVNQCVFCAQDLIGSPIIENYRAFFGQAYRDHQQNIQTVGVSFYDAHPPNNPLLFERTVNTLRERLRFWSGFGNFPEMNIDPAAIISDWIAARMHIDNLLQLKRSAPLDIIQISDEARLAVSSYTVRRNEISEFNQQLLVANRTIAEIKQQAAIADTATLTSTLENLKATKSRYTTETDALCRDYLSEKASKVTTEQLRNQARQALDQYRIQVFPIYEAAINIYLQRFNAGFQLASVTALNTRGGPACSYSVVVNNTSVSVGGPNPQPGEHSFKNVLSAGDRNTLAVAFFLASIELDPSQANKIIVIDDPVSSLDEHRSLTTVNEIRRLLNQVEQVVILSHSKPFLCRVWESATLVQKAALQVVRSANASTISAWDVNADSETENDRRHNALRVYLTNGGQNEREIAVAIRPCLEAFFRVAYPEHYPPGTLLGPFRGTCSQRVGTAQAILSQLDIDELRDIVDYANLFHHDSNPAWETEVINSTQLEGFVRRTLVFAKRP